jgi:hypothetical protein
MTDLTTAIQDITKQAEIADNATRNVGDNMKLGEAVRQGDLYLFKVEKDVSGLKAIPGQKQLVPGTTQGSRHHAEAPAVLFENDGSSVEGIDTNALLGPIVDSPSRFEVSHPEHAHISLPAGTYQVLYQLDFQAQRRVAD